MSEPTIIPVKFHQGTFYCEHLSGPSDYSYIGDVDLCAGCDKMFDEGAVFACDGMLLVRNKVGMWRRATDVTWLPVMKESKARG